MGRVVAEAGAGYVAMHMQGTPRTMQSNPAYQDVVEEIYQFFKDRLTRLEAVGVHHDQIVLDVGIGFGKTLNHNLELLGALNRFTRFNRPLLLGVSRKSFISSLLGLEMEARLPAALACACWAVPRRPDHRTHDAADTIGVRMAETIRM
jgi:dihydropteroate synthase